jgi:SAM-dependent methyltransferase
MPGWWLRRRRAARIRQAHRLLNLLDGGDPELTARFARIVADAVGRRVAAPTDAAGRPHLDALSMALKDIPNTTRSVKAIAAHIAREERARLADKPAPKLPRRIGLTGRLCRQADIDSPWMWHWFSVMGTVPSYHRKAWESAFVLQGLWEAGMLAPGRRGLGFAVGKEPLPSIFAARGAEVLATDLDAGDSRAASWATTNQNAAQLEDLHWPRLVDRETFLARCRFRAVDMNHLPADLAGGFDFVWSSCSFEHLGSIEKGLAFVENAMACLRPGGVAVHTTEFRFHADGALLDNWGTVLFRRQDMEALAARLAARGHEMLPIDYRPGHRPLDGYVDVPPFGAHRGEGFALHGVPHLRLSVDGFAATSIGIIVRAGVSP